VARPPRHLNDEERDLWDRVARTAAPINRPRTVLGERSDPPSTPNQPKPHPRPPLKHFRLGETLTGPPETTVTLSPTVGDRVAAEPLAMDRKAYKRLARGKLKPEARLDLHGMTLAQAHPALTDFILNSQAAGRRLVLIITGKGRGTRDEPGPIPVRRGVLREQVPRWLRSAPCARAVLQIAQAHVSHGGEGAWYVYLRRPR